MGLIPPDLLNTITTGDARVLAERLPDESVDMVFCDPPYLRAFEWAWLWLSELGQRVLRPGGLLLTYTGKHNLPFVYESLGTHLKYFWQFEAVHLESDTRFNARHVFSNYRPIPAYYKPNGRDPHCLNWVGDAVKSIRDKRFHEWGQGANVYERYIDRLTVPGAIVFDPFTGGGTVPAVCKILGRQYVAFEIDPDTAERARERVLHTQPPLFVVQPEQVELGL